MGTYVHKLKNKDKGTVRTAIKKEVIVKNECVALGREATSRAHPAH